jgi:Kdo2-lipid IVA lauroyltransferase/acyltransferase
VLISKANGIKPVLKALKDRLPFYYLPDQDQGRHNAVFVPFFGVPAATLSALPRLAKLTDAQVVPVITRQLPGEGLCRAFLSAVGQLSRATTWKPTWRA